MAGVTALVSGVSVFVNSYGVHHVPSAAVYTSAKNLVAFAFLGAGALAVAGWRRASGRPGPGPVPAPPPERPRRRWRQWAGLAYVGVVGGGIAFVLFFDGLARTSATPAAFLHDSLVVWVAVLAVPLLGERLTAWNMGAIVLLVGGEVALSHGIGHLALSAGNLLVLAATGLWAVEVVVAKRLLAGLAPATLGTVRMGVGSLTLVAYLAATGSLHGLVTLGAGQVGWALLTGGLLAAYVGTWMTALLRARALDVTSVLVAGALVTALLQAAAGSAPLAPAAGGLVLVAAGTALVATGMVRRPRPVTR